MSLTHKENIIPKALFEKITEIRVKHPGYVLDQAQNRIRRKSFTNQGKLNIVAADHPARGSLSAGNNEFAMADRHELLARLTVVLQSEWVDGVLASMDIFDDLLILHGLTGEKNGSLLDDKLLIGSFNRAGLPGSAWELNDPITGPNAETLIRYGIDAAKMLLRVDYQHPDSLKTIEYCAEGIRSMNSVNRPIFIEPLPVERRDNSYKVNQESDQLIPLMAVSAALGNNSRNTWLKIPLTDHFERVVASTTLPIVILGGGKSQTSEEFIAGIEKAMKSGHQVRGTMIGRNILYPADSTPLEMAESIGKVVHRSQVPTS